MAKKEEKRIFFQMLDVIFPAQKADQQFKEDFFAVCKDLHKLNIFTEENFNNIIRHRNVRQIIRALAFLSKITNRGPGFPTVYPLLIASENEHIDVAAHLLYLLAYWGRFTNTIFDRVLAHTRPAVILNALKPYFGLKSGGPSDVVTPP